MKIALNRFSLALAASLLSATALAGSAQAQDEGLVVYNAQHESLGREWIDAFTKETGIKVTMRQGSDMQFANQIIQEGDASPADVFLTENSPAMTLVDGAGLFAPIEKETLDQVPDQYRPADGMWTGIAARTTVFAYDKTKLTEDKLPKSMLDLADPAWKGRWGAAPAGADFQAIVAALLQLKGEDATKAWLKGLKDNATPYKGNSVAHEGRQFRRSRRRDYLSLLLVRRSGQTRREQQECRPALLQEPGSGRFRQRFGRRHPEVHAAHEGSPGFPEVPHQQGRPGSPQGRRFL